MNKPEEGGSDIRAQLGVVGRWAWLIGLTTLLAAATAFVVSRASRPVYEASAALVVGQNQTSNPPQYSEVELNLQLAKTFAQLIKERPVLREVAAQLNLPADQASLDALDQAVTIEQVKDTQLIRVAVRGTNPAQAADTANTIMQVFAQRSQGDIAAGLGNSMQALDREMQDVQAQIDATEGSLEAEKAKPNADAAAVARLQQSLDRQRTTLASLQQSYDQLRVVQARGSNLLTVFEAAEVPTEPVLPRTNVNVLLALVVGAMLSTSTAFFVEYLDDAVRRPEDVERAAGLTTLATVARLRRGGDEPLLATDPTTAFAESYRSLRAAIHLSGIQKEEAAPLLLVAGVQARAGSSTVLSNLGVSLAQAGRKVLLVDANLRRPTLHRQFRLGNDVGLTDLLAQRVEAQQAIQETAVTGLRVLTAGPLPTRTGDVLGAPGVAALLQQLRRQADLVLLDGPSVQGVADACLLAHESDGVLLVAEAGRTRRADLQQAVSALQRCNTRLLGVVLNKGQDRAAGA